MDIKSFLEFGTSLKWQETMYKQPPNPPYFIFLDDVIVRGADKLNNILEHNLTLECYEEKVDKQIKKKIEDFLNSHSFKFEANTEWISDEELYVTIYELTFLEKIRKESEENVKTNK